MYIFHNCGFLSYREKKRFSKGGGGDNWFFSRNYTPLLYCYSVLHLVSNRFYWAFLEDFRDLHRVEVRHSNTLNQPLKLKIYWLNLSEVTCFKITNIKFNRSYRLRKFPNFNTVLKMFKGSNFSPELTTFFNLFVCLPFEPVSQVPSRFQPD